MIDINQPLELDDGTPVEFVKVYDHAPDQVYVNIPDFSSVYRNNGANGGTFWYSRKTGIFGGGNEKYHKVLRNRFFDESEFEPDLDL